MINIILIYVTFYHFLAIFSKQNQHHFYMIKRYGEWNVLLARKLVNKIAKSRGCDVILWILLPNCMWRHFHFQFEIVEIVNLFIEWISNWLRTSQDAVWMHAHTVTIQSTTRKLPITKNQKIYFTFTIHQNQSCRLLWKPYSSTWLIKPKEIKLTLQQLENLFGHCYFPR